MDFCPKTALIALYEGPDTMIPWPSPTRPSPTRPSFLSGSCSLHKEKLFSIMTKAKAPPPTAATPDLDPLPSIHNIVLAKNRALTLYIIQGVMWTRSHIPPAGIFAALEQLLLEPKPPAIGPIHCQFRFR